MSSIYIGKRIKISVFLPQALFLWYIFAGKELFLSALLSVILHEAAHLISARILKHKVKTFTLTPFGADILYSGHLSYTHDIIISLSGPLMNLLCFALFINTVPLFSLSSAVYGLLNLLPLPGFDGGRILCAFLYKKLDFCKAEKCTGVLNVIFLFFTYIFASFLLFYSSFNLSLFLVVCGVFFKSMKTKE